MATEAGKPLRRGPYRLWTELEDVQLLFYWGRLELEELATKLGRSPSALTERARKLKAPPPSSETKTMNELVRTSGYAISRIRSAAKALNFIIRRSRRTDPRQGHFTHDFAITERQEKAILDFLGVRPDTERLYRPDGKRTQRGVWGIGIKPAACLGCTTTAQPHFAKGLCKKCYMKPYLEKKKKKSS